MPQSRLRADLVTAGRCDAYTSPSLDLHLRKHIDAAWRGRGPAIVINDTVLVAESYRRDAQVARSEALRLGKALASVIKCRDELERRMRQA